MPRDPLDEDRVARSETVLRIETASSTPETARTLSSGIPVTTAPSAM